MFFTIYNMYLHLAKTTTTTNPWILQYTPQCLCTTCCFSAKTSFPGLVGKKVFALSAITDIPRCGHRLSQEEWGFLTPPERTVHSCDVETYQNLVWLGKCTQPLVHICLPLYLPPPVGNLWGPTVTFTFCSMSHKEHS